MRNERKKTHTKDNDYKDNTPYDDVGKTMLIDCPSTIFPLVNEIFGEHYTGTEVIEFLHESNYVNLTEKEMIRGYRDAYFKIIGEKTKNYHIELQSTEDHTMVLRMFEYDIGASIKESVIDGNKLIVTIAQSAVVYLRHNKNTPDTLEVEIHTPGGNVVYAIPIIKIKKYTLDEIFEKNLLFFLPFYIFGYEEELGILNKNREKLERLEEEYRRIKNYLNTLYDTGRITEREKSIIISMIKKVIRNLAAKYENVKKGVEHIMGGRLLIHEAYVLMEKGRAMERKNTEEAEQRAIAAEKRAEEAERRAIEAERLYSKLKEMLNEKQNLQKI